MSGRRWLPPDPPEPRSDADKLSQGCTVFLVATLISLGVALAFVLGVIALASWVF